MSKTRPNPKSPEFRFGQRLRQWRHNNGVTLKEFCEETRFSMGYVSDLETGKRGISLGNAYRIAAYTGKYLSWFTREGK